MPITLPTAPVSEPFIADIPIIEADSIPQSIAPPSMTDAFGENPWDIEERQQTIRRNQLLSNALTKIDQAALDPETYFKEQDMSMSLNPIVDQKLATVDAFLRLQNGGEPFDISPNPHANDLTRATIRQRVALDLFNGRGADDDDAFFNEIRSSAQNRKERRENRQALGVTLATMANTEAIVSLADPGKAQEYTWPSFLDQARKSPGYTPEDEASLYEAYNATRSESQAAITSFAPELKTIWEAMKAGPRGNFSQIANAAIEGINTPGGIISGALQAYAEASTIDAPRIAIDTYYKLTEEERPQFMQALATLARTLPKEQQPAFFSNLAKQGGRDIDDLARNINSIGLPNSSQEDFDRRKAGMESRKDQNPVLRFLLGGEGGGLDAATYDPAMEEAIRTGQTKLLAARNFASDVRNIERQDYNPVKSAWGDEEKGMIETGLYGVPGALASSALTAIPYVGPVAMFSSMEGAAYDDIRRNLMNSGMSDTNASQTASQWATAAAVPQAALEKLQAAAILGKLPFLDKFFTSIGDKITSNALRFGMRTTIGAAQETTIEAAQDLIPYIGQELAATLSSEIPNVTWSNGKDGALDGFWTQQGTIFVTMLPLAIIGAAGGISTDKRIQAFQNASDNTLLALGASQEQLAELRAAQAAGMETYKRTLPKILDNLDPSSETAKAAVEAIVTEELAKQGIVTEATQSGILPRFTRTSQGWTLHDSETGAEIGTAPNAETALRLAQTHTDSIDETDANRFAYMATMLEAGDFTSLTESFTRKTTTDFRPGETVTPAQQAAISPEDAARVAAQIQLREKMEGGTGEVAGVVFGQSSTSFENNQRRTVNRLNQGASVLTVFHEETHGFWREAVATGRLTRNDSLSVLRALDTILANKTTRKIRDGKGKLVDGGKPIRFLPADFDTLNAQQQETAIDEAISELMEAEVLRTRKGTGVRKIPAGIISRNLAALTRIAGGQATNKFRAFARALRSYFGIAIDRAASIDRAIKDGTIDQNQYNDFLNRLLGQEDQAALEQKARDYEAQIINGTTTPEAIPEGDPFSIGKARTEQDTARLEKKHRRQLLAEAMGGFPEIQDQLQGKIPHPETLLSKQHPLAGEVRRIWESMKKPTRRRDKTGRTIDRTNEANAYFLPIGEMIDIDTVREAMNEKGFDFQTPADMLDALESSISYNKPHADQAVGKWTTNDLLNTSLLITKEMENTRKILPESKALRYDFATDTFTRDGNAVTTEELAQLIEDTKSFDKGIGLSTLQRAVITASAIDEFQRGTAESIVQQAESDLPASLTGVSYSLGPAALADAMRQGAIARIKDPQRRVRAMSNVARKMEQIHLVKARLELIHGSKRAKASLKKEAAFREATLAEQYENEAYARHYGILEDDDLRKIKSQPVHSFLADPESPLRGVVMSKSQAIKHHPDMFRLHRAGEYDGSDGVSRSVFGGYRMPDLAAQDLYEANLIKEPTADAMWQALLKEQAMVSKMKELHIAAKEDIRNARTRAKQETNEWLAAEVGKQEANFSPKQEVLDALALLEAILSSVSPEIRGKVGGYTQLAQLGTDESRLAFLTTRLERIDKLLEEELRATFNREMLDLLKRAKPQRDAPGEKPKGTAGSDIHDLFREIEKYMGLPMLEAEGRAADLESQVASGELTPEQESHNTILANLLRLTSDWTKADAARREAAVTEATRIFAKGYLEHRIIISARSERRQRDRSELKANTGKSGVRAERRKKAKQQATKIGRTFESLLSLLSYEQITQLAFGKDSEIGNRLVDWERRAAYARHDSIHAKTTAIEDLFTSLARNVLKGEKLRYDMGNIDSITVTNSRGTHDFTQLEAISATLMWMQEDGRRHMEGHLDDAGNPVGEWGWTQADMDSIESQLTDEAKAVRVHLQEQYAAEYDRLNIVYSDIYGVNLPRHKFYSPLTVKPQSVQAGQVLDPVSGFAVSGGFSPGSLKTRSQNAVAEPDFRDALATYIGHTTQIEHFIAYAPFATEAMALINTREVGNAVEAKAGQETISILRKWLDQFSQGGNRDAAAYLAFNQSLNRASSRVATAALVGRVSVLAIQSTQLGAALAEMPTGAYLSRFAKLSTGQLDWSAAIKSDYIQRRVQQMPPIVRQAMEGLKSSKPNQIKHAMAKLGETINGADALFTAGTYAIILDYQKSQGLTGQALIEVTERSVERVAQPTRTATRSLYEVTGSSNPNTRILWAFASETRQKLALAGFRLATAPAGEKARALAVTWIAGGVVAALIRTVMRDIRDSDDEEIFDERNWSIKRLALMSITGPLGGLPVFGDTLEAIAFKAFGEYLPEGNLFSQIANITRLKNVPDWFTGERDAEEIIGDIDAILGALAPVSDTNAATSAAFHIVKDAEAIIRNLLSD